MKISKILLSTFLIGTLFSCAKLDTAPIDVESELTFWDKPEDATNALNACYPDLYDAETFAFMESLSDNAYTKSNNGSKVRDVANGNFDPSHPLITAVWSQRYAGIKRCNLLLNNIDKVPGLTAELKAQYIAEAKAIRAFHYFILSTLYGDVPLFENEISISESQTIGRTEKSKVVDFILTQLDEASQVLPATYTTDKGRFTKGAALALKARVLLFEGRWQDVITATESIMGGTNGTFGLFADYAGLFKQENEYNKEVLLDDGFMPITREHGIQYYLIPPTQGGYASISPLQELVDDYIMLNGKGINEAGSGYNLASPYNFRDSRLRATIVCDSNQWIKPDGTLLIVRTSPGTGANSINNSSNATPTGYYVAKFYDKTARNKIYSGTNLILIRYAEVLLMYAEAKNELGQFGQAEWDKSIRLLRQRAGFTNNSALDFPALSQDELRKIIRRERRCELAMEGLRYFDIRRWKTAETALNGWAHGMRTNISVLDNGFERVDFRTFDAARHYLWPIPQSERDLNPNLTQNPNW